MIRRMVFCWWLLEKKVGKLFNGDDLVMFFQWWCWGGGWFNGNWCLGGRGELVEWWFEGVELNKEYFDV